MIQYEFLFQPTVIELHIPISEKMKKMQTYILELMNLTVKELKRINKGVELQVRKTTRQKCCREMMFCELFETHWFWLVTNK